MTVCSGTRHSAAALPYGGVEQMEDIVQLCNNAEVLVVVILVLVQRMGSSAGLDGQI